MLIIRYALLLLFAPLLLLAIVLMTVGSMLK